MRKDNDASDGQARSWPFATGAMADAIRSFSWPSTPLGPIEHWPAPLVFSVNGILEQCLPGIVVWGPERIGLYNDACLKIFGPYPSPLGQPVDVAWAGVWHRLQGVYEDAFAGKAGHLEDLRIRVARPGLPDLSWWTVSCAPIRDENGHVRGVRAVVFESSTRVRLELRQSLLLKVGDSLRRLRDPAEMVASVARELLAFLDVERGGGCDIDESAGLAMPYPGWGLGADAAGWGEAVPLEDFGYGLLARLRANEVTAIDDVTVDPLVGVGPLFARAGIRSALMVPSIRDGALAKVLILGSSRPHAWQSEDREVAAAVAERMWEAAERALAEASLRASRLRLDSALEAARMVAWEWRIAEDRVAITGNIGEVFGPEARVFSGVGRDAFGCIHPDDRDRHRRTVEQAVAGETGYESEFRIVRPHDGGIAWLEERAQPVRDPVTGRLGLAGLAWDVTRRKTAELAIEEARREVADELSVLTRLHGWAVRGASPAEWQSLLEEMLDAIMVLLGADFGTIRLYDPADETLKLVAHRNIGTRYAERYGIVSATDETLVWFRPLKSGQRVVYDDLSDDLSRTVLCRGASEHGCNALQVTPLKDRTGTPVGALWTAFRAPHRPTDRAWRLVDLYCAQIADLISAKRAHDALEASERRQRMLIENMPLLVWRSAWDGQASWHSPQWHAFTGIRRGEALGHGWLETIHPDDRPNVMKAWAEAGERGLYICECRIWGAAEKRYRWFQERAVAEPVGEGGSIEWIGTSTDIDALRTLHEQQRTLLAELQYRVRQTLSQSRTIVRRTATTGTEFEQYVRRLDGRLGALSRAQGPALRDPGAGIELSELVTNELTAHQAREGDRVSVTGPPLRLRPGSADTLALALHELAANAVEHGALARERGRIRVDWRIEQGEETPRLLFSWTESRCALPPPAEPVREGFGFQFLKRTLADELKAETLIDFTSRGLVCTIRLPLTERVVLL